jgi:hypothetical protein
MRLPDWEQRLSDYLAAARDRAHAYGSHDCALHGASAVQAMTGEDPLAAYRGHYSTELGAARALRRLGVKQATLEATFDALFSPIPKALAGRGDLVMADGSIGVCIGGEALFVSDDGLVRVVRAAWSKAWRV